MSWSSRPLPRCHLHAPLPPRSSHTSVPPTRRCRPAAPRLLQSAAKRYKVTGSGKVMVRRAGKQHLNEKQSRKTKRNLRWALAAGCLMQGAAAMSCAPPRTKPHRAGDTPPIPPRDVQPALCLMHVCSDMSTAAAAAAAAAALQQDDCCQRDAQGPHPRLPALCQDQVIAASSPGAAAAAAAAAATRYCGERVMDSSNGGWRCSSGASRAAVESINCGVALPAPARFWF